MDVSTESWTVWATFSSQQCHGNSCVPDNTVSSQEAQSFYNSEVIILGVGKRRQGDGGCCSPDPELLAEACCLPQPSRKQTHLRLLSTPSAQKSTDFISLASALCNDWLEEQVNIAHVEVWPC